MLSNLFSYKRNNYSLEEKFKMGVIETNIDSNYSVVHPLFGKPEKKLDPNNVGKYENDEKCKVFTNYT